MSSNLTVFMENKPGKLEKLTGILADGKIDIRGITVASSGEYGIVKLLVDDVLGAAELLKKNKVTVSIRPVLVAIIRDEPGGFHNLLLTLSEHGHNLEDCYGFVLEAGKRAAVVFETENEQVTAEFLRSKNIEVLTDSQIREL